MSEVRDRIVAIIATECDVNPADIKDDSSLESLGISSVDLVQVMFQVEEAFDVYLADENIGFEIDNVGQMIGAVEKLVASKSATA